MSLHTKGLIYQLGGCPVGAEDLLMAGGKWYFCDPTHGLSSNDGSTPSLACSDLLALYNKLRDGYNDGIFFLGGATAAKPTALIPWSKNYAHLIGVSADLPGVGQRARIVGDSTNDLVEILTISGSGCVFKNIQLFNGANNAADNGAATVSGDHNVFTNVFFAGMGDATASGAQARTGGYSLTLTGSENFFSGCAVGLDTIQRTAANYELIVGSASKHPARNLFDRCRFQSWTDVTTKALVDIVSVDRYIGFTNCQFWNFSATGTKMVNAILDGETYYAHQIDLTDSYLNPLFITGWADVVTNIYSGSAAPGAGFGIGVKPTT